MHLRIAGLTISLLLCAAQSHAQSISRIQDGPTRQVQTAGTTSATVGTFTTALVDGMMVRQGCQLVNTGSGTLYAYLKSAAAPMPTTASSVPIAAGTTWSCPRGSNNELDVAGTTANQPYIVLAW